MSAEIANISREFVQFVKERIDEVKDKEEFEIRGIPVTHFRWELRDFEYDLKKGVVSSGASGVYTTIEEKVYIHDVDEKLKESEKYKEIKIKLFKLVNVENLDFRLNSLAKRIAHDYFRNILEEDKIIENFSKEISEEPLKLRAKIELLGLTLECDEIKLSQNIKLRRTKREDIEKEQIIYTYSGLQETFLSYPSAILEIEIFGKSDIDIQKEIEKNIIILRLFGVGGAKYITYALSSDFISMFVGGIITSNERSPVPTSYIIYNKDMQRLNKFWNELYNLIPNNFQSNAFMQKANLNFSYQRYSESLLSNDLIERRIANAISGLESIYLCDSRELIRYLKLSIGKVMSLFGRDPYEIMDAIDEGYSVRSKFIHGSKMGHEMKRKLERKYGSLEALLASILDYLRVSILLMLFINKEKEEFIDLIEDSFIDKNKEQLLSQQIANIKSRLGEK